MANALTITEARSQLLEQAEQLMRAPRRSVKEARTGRTIPWEKVKQDLGLLG